MKWLISKAFNWRLIDRGLIREGCFSQWRGASHRGEVYLRGVMLRLEASLKLAKEYYESHSYLPKHIRVCGCNRLLRKSAIYIHSCILSTSVTSYLNLLQKFSC